MSLMRAGTAACFRAGRLAFPVNARFVATNTGRGDPAVKTKPSDAPAVPPKESSMIQEETPAEAMARHQPDYEATIDHGTSYASPFQ